MSNPEKLKRAVIKEEYIAITGNFAEAVILNQFIYWSERVRDFDKFAEEENERIQLQNENDENTMYLSHGWIYKKAEEMSQETMLGLSPNAIRRHIEMLVEKGFLKKRRNPRYRWDKTFQYRVDFQNVIIALHEKDYHLEGYRYNFDFEEENEVTSKMDDRTSKIEVRTSENGGAIPYTTTYTTNKEINNRTSKIEGGFGILGNFIDSFKTHYYNSFGKRYTLSMKDKKRLSSLENNVTAEYVEDMIYMIPTYFKSDDSFIQNSDYSIYYFFYDKVQNYLVAKHAQTNKGRWQKQGNRMFEKLSLDGVNEENVDEYIKNNVRFGANADRDDYVYSYLKTKILKAIKRNNEESEYNVGVKDNIIY